MLIEQIQQKAQELSNLGIISADYLLGRDGFDQEAIDALNQRLRELHPEYEVPLTPDYQTANLDRIRDMEATRTGMLKASEFMQRLGAKINDVVKAELETTPGVQVSMLIGVLESLKQDYILNSTVPALIAKSVPSLKMIG